MKTPKWIFEWIFALPIAFIVFLAVLICLMMGQQNDYKESCKSLGGVPIDSYRSTNCWKDGGYINVERS